MLFLFYKGIVKQRAALRKEKHVPLAEFVRGTDENNLAEFPLALLSDIVPANQRTLEFEDTVKDWKTGQQVTRRVCVTGSDLYGLPTAKDDQVLAALLQLTGIANNFTNPEVTFTKHQIIQLLGWDNSGWAYERIEESLHRWKGVSVHYWNAWRDHARGSWTDTEAVGIIEYFKLTDGRRHQASRGPSTQSSFIWNRQLFKSFQSGYLKPLDFGFYRSLKRPAAQRAYRFLDKRFFHEPEWEFDLRTFACEKLGFSRNYDTGQLKARLTPAMEELERAGYIKPVSYRKVRPKIWTISVARQIPEQRSLPTTQSEPASLLHSLVDRGVSKSTAAALIREFSAPRIEEKIGVFDWLTSRRDKRISANAPGFLVTAIRKDYAAPKDYRKSKQQKPPPRAATVTMDEAVTKVEWDACVEEYLAPLTMRQRIELEAAAVAAADPHTAEGYRRSLDSGGPSFVAYQRMVISRYVRGLKS
ncbi:replication initiator protein A [Aeoliella sp. SH292]|uniref:replication initiator protein A n=1 Tax=Aeoliella sp. SH292 TaxID=3454464 RepID=UPI003F95487A